MSPRLKEAPDGRSVVFEDRPFVLPAIFAAAAAFLAGHALFQYQALMGGEKEALGLILSALFSALAGALFSAGTTFSSISSSAGYLGANGRCSSAARARSILPRSPGSRSSP